MSDYSFRVRCTVEKLVIVEASSPEEATKKMAQWDAVDETELSLDDWTVVDGPTLEE
jgi:hypothetical protein